MTTYYHGTDRANPKAHIGLCLTLSRTAAADYGGTVYAVEVDEDAISWDTVTVGEARAMGDDGVYPGDTAEGRRILAEELGVDAVWYADVTPSGSETFRCLRLLTADAVEAVTSFTAI